DEEAEEAADGGELARDRGAVDRAVERPQPVPDVTRPDAMDAVRADDGEELADVAQVRAQGVRRRAALRAEMRGPRFHGVGRRPRRSCRHGKADAITTSGRDKVRANPTIAAIGIALLLGAADVACRADPSTARGTAERFLDAHYVEIDLPSALPFTSGLARHKVEEEIELVKGIEVDETTRKPTVHYALLEEHPDGDGSTKFLYQGK